MSNKLPPKIKEQVAQMPEYKYGANKVTVTLKDGRVFTDVFIAWSDEIVKVGTSADIPFQAEDVADAQSEV